MTAQETAQQTARAAPAPARAPLPAVGREGAGASWHVLAGRPSADELAAVVTVLAAAGAAARAAGGAVEPAPRGPRSSWADRRRTLRRPAADWLGPPRWRREAP